MYILKGFFDMSQDNLDESQKNWVHTFLQNETYELK